MIELSILFWNLQQGVLSADHMPCVPQSSYQCGSTQNCKLWLLWDFFFLKNFVFSNTNLAKYSFVSPCPKADHEHRNAYEPQNSTSFLSKEANCILTTFQARKLFSTLLLLLQILVLGDFLVSLLTMDRRSLLKSTLLFMANLFIYDHLLSEKILSLIRKM